jgi:hypothetical protein
MCRFMLLNEEIPVFLIAGLNGRGSTSYPFFAAEGRGLDATSKYGANSAAARPQARSRSLRPANLPMLAADQPCHWAWQMT